MVERQEVEALLDAVKGSEHYAPIVRPQALAALCRAWLAVQEAPEVTVKEALFADGHRVGKIVATADASMIGQRVRIVKEVG